MPLRRTILVTPSLEDRDRYQVKKMPLIIHKIPIAHALGRANYNSNKLNVLTHQYNNILSTKQRCAMCTQNSIDVKPKTVNKNQRQEGTNAGNSIDGIRNRTCEMPVYSL